MLPADKIAAIDYYVAGHWSFIHVTTEQGVTGAGEATYFPHPLAVRAILDDMRDAYIGKSPFRPEFLFNLLNKKHCLRDTASMSVFSALDQALWDIKARTLDVPVYELLGGRVRDRVRAILLIEAATEEEIVAKAIAARDEGFTALKIKPFLSGWSTGTEARLLNTVVETIRAVRAAVGWDVDLAVEVHRNLTPDRAVQFADMVRDQLLLFIEDPILPFSIANNSAVAEAMRAPTALAERNTSIWEFREASDCRHIAYLRPDIGLAGGFSQLRKIAAIAESRHQRILPHNFTSPVSTACHIQMAAATSNWDLQGYIRENRQPWTDVVNHVNRLKDGYLVIPETPGIGLELNLDYLKSASYVPFGGAFMHEAPLAADGGVKLQ